MTKIYLIDASVLVQVLCKPLYLEDNLENDVYLEVFTSLDAKEICIPQFILGKYTEKITNICTQRVGDKEDQKVLMTALDKSLEFFVKNMYIWEPSNKEYQMGLTFHMKHLKLKPKMRDIDFCKSWILALGKYSKMPILSVDRALIELGEAHSVDFFHI